MEMGGGGLGVVGQAAVAGWVDCSGEQQTRPQPLHTADPPKGRREHHRSQEVPGTMAYGIDP